MSINTDLAASSSVPKLEQQQVSSAPVQEELNDKKINELEEQKQAALEVSSPENLEKLADELSEMMSMMKKNLVFRVDNSSGKSVVSVMDEESGQLIRQIPSEEALALAEKMSDITGLIMKTKA